MIRYKVYHRQLRQICDVIVRDNEKRYVILEYLDKTVSTYPYGVTKKRIKAEMDEDLKTIRFAERYDRQNDPLYDGDIIEEYDFFTGRKWLGLIRWDKERGQFIEEVTKTPLTALRLSSVKKIGNIFEEPDLISLFNAGESYKSEGET
ncbi:MAG TPA: hypothetical protein VMW41_03835 [Candidatus Bathyarchaeia archaeon]|nr:hypothetical protein [Candidatus Bathyarchaeia archaeon]